MKKLSILIAGILFTLFSAAQTSKITGSVSNADDKKPVHNAVVALLTPKDSILYKFTRTDASGKFTLNDVKHGNYILMTTHPYYADLLDTVNIQSDMQLAGINILSKAKLLQNVIIKTGSALHIKGDTTVYTADSFKVGPNANVEELLKKLPGIQVDKNGTITAMGETVQKVLVDGEEFFGDDPGMAVKNLRADAVKEVQVFDKKSDQAEFTGIDDGKTQKTINLKLKDNAKHGYFGKIDLSGGTVQNKENRYNENLMYSNFRGKRKLSGFLLTGNTGQDGLNWQDEQKYGGDNDNFSMNIDDDGNVNFMWNGSNDDEPYVDPNNGYITNVNAGILYSNKWNDKYNLNLTPKYNSQDYTNITQTFTETSVGDSILDNNTSQTNNVNRHNFKIRGILDTKFDSSNSLKITANTNFYHTISNGETDAVSTGNNGTLKNTSNRNLKTENDKSAISGNFLFRHKFKKERRTLSVTGSWNVLNNDGTDFLKSANQSYFDGNPAGSQNLDQMKSYNTATTNLSTKVTYTEPLGKKYSLEGDYQVAYNYGTNNQLTYNYTPFSNKYDVLVDSLSNQFKQNIIQNIPSARINYADKKLKMNIGSGFGFTNFDLKDLTYDKDYKRDYVNFYPTANITYTYKPNRSIRFRYNGNTTQPTINQLQPLRNNNDYFNQYIGNPDLKPSFTNSFNLSHNSYNFLKDVWMYQSLNFRTTSNSIANSQTINVDSGKTITQPVNTNGNWSLNFWSGMGFKIKKIDTRLNFNPNLNYNQFTNIVNGKNNVSKTFAPGLNIGVSKSKEKKYDLNISDEFSYNSNVTTQNDTRIHYNTNTIYFNGTLYIHKVWQIITDMQLYSQQKTSQLSHNINYTQWNARLQRTFRHDEFTAYFSVHDILDQNIGIDRNFFGNTYTQTTNERLRRYFMIGFSWDFKNKTVAPKKN